MISVCIVVVADSLYLQKLRFPYAALEVEAEHRYASVSMVDGNALTIGSRFEMKSPNEL